jgi:hypothetical protein
MDLKELKSKAFDIRAAADFKQHEIKDLMEEYNKIVPEIFRLEQEANKLKTEPDINPIDRPEVQPVKPKKY